AAGAAFGFFFIIAALFIWAASAWTVPYGGVVAGVYWVPFLFWALIIGLIFAALTPRSRDLRDDAESVPPQDPAAVGSTEAAAAGVFGVFFFTLLVLLLIVGISAAFIH
ncbi:MAG: hypothetical protein ACFB21_16775, partial [Opitutales bacterium]